jgi:hypothetical protein
MADARNPANYMVFPEASYKTEPNSFSEHRPQTTPEHPHIFHSPHKPQPFNIGFQYKYFLDSETKSLFPFSSTAE